MTSKRFRFWLSTIFIVGVCIFAAWLTRGVRSAGAATSNLTTVQFSNLVPIYTDPDRNAASVGATAAIGIANPSVTQEAAIQRLLITNKSTVNDLCVYWVATTSVCGSSITCDGAGTDNGDLILPRSVKEVHVAGDLRTCVVASASPTAFHISRSKVE